MQTRQLGQRKLSIPPLVIGTMDRHQAPDSLRINMIREAMAAGFNAFDTAPLYDFGRAERQLGEALGDVPRDQVYLFSKVGLRWDAGDVGEVLFSEPDRDGVHRVVRRNSRPESIVEEVEHSLTRLQTDYLDLVQIHQPDPQTPIAESMAALLDLRREGKVREIGVSNFSAEQVGQAQKALGETGLCAVQSEYNLLRRGVEKVLLPLCNSQGIGFLAYSPLAGGLLSGRNNAQLSPSARSCVEGALASIAAEHGATAAVIALAWLIAQPGVSAGLVGMSSLEQVPAYAEAAELELPPAHLGQLADAFAGAQIVHAWEQNPLRRRIGRLLRALRR